MRAVVDPEPPTPGLSLRAALLVVAAALVPYLLLPPKPLILDAARSIFDNPVVLEGSLAKIFTYDYWGVPGDATYGTRSYRPLVTLTFALQARTMGTAPQVFHLTDMAIHALGSILVALILLRLAPGSRFAIPAAMVFAAHPALSEAVASAVGRADLMASTAMLGGVLLHLNAPRSARPWVLESGALLCGAAGLLCKEYAVVFPALLALAGWATAQTLDLSRAHRRRQRTVWIIAGGILVLYLLLRLKVLGALGGVPMIGPGDHPLFDKSLDVRWGTAATLLVHAGRLLVVPVGLNYFYGYGTLPIASGILDGRALLGMLFVAALIAAGVWGIKRANDPRLAIAAGLFLLPLAPSINTVSLAGVLFAERYLYAPAAGFALMLVFLGDRWLTRERARQAGVVALFALAAVFAILTMGRVQQWTSPKELAESSLRWYPQSANVWFELGLAHGGLGDHQSALEAFERSLQTQQNRPQVWREYAVALMHLGRFDESVKAWQRVLKLSPQDLGPLWRGLGNAELAAGQIEGAVRSLGRAHELNSSDEVTALNLSRSLLQLAQRRVAEKRAPEAMDLVERAIAIGALPPEGLYLAGLIATASNEAGRASQLFGQALERDPDLLRKKHAVAIEFDAQGKYLEAAQQYREILAAMPEHVPSRFNLGRSLLLAGRAEEAAYHLRRGLSAREDPGARALLVEAERRNASANRARMR